MQVRNIIKRLSGRKDETSGGFSLVEMLIAMTIMSIGLLAIAQMQMVAMHQNMSNAIRADAELVGQNQMEVVLNQPPVNTALGDAPNDPNMPNILRLAQAPFSPLTAHVPGDPVSFNVTTAVAALQPDGARPVTVSVTYNDGIVHTGVTHTITFNTTKTAAEVLQ
jgi:type IV pilus modification protein PilV